MTKSPQLRHQQSHHKDVFLSKCKHCCNDVIQFSIPRLKSTQINQHHLSTKGTDREPFMYDVNHVHQITSHVIIFFFLKQFQIALKALSDRLSKTESASNSSVAGTSAWPTLNDDPPKVSDAVPTSVHLAPSPTPASTENKKDILIDIGESGIGGAPKS